MTLKHFLRLNGETVPIESKTKYLGVTVLSDLSWNTYCKQIRAKASKTLGLIRRTMGKCSNYVEDLAYRTLVRPQLEDATSAWSPHTERNCKVLESVQRQQGCRYCVQSTVVNPTPLVQMLLLVGLVKQACEIDPQCIPIEV